MCVAFAVNEQGVTVQVNISQQELGQPLSPTLFRSGG